MKLNFSERNKSVWLQQEYVLNFSYTLAPYEKV